MFKGYILEHRGLVRIIDEVTGITVAEVLSAIADLVEPPKILKENLNAK
jgi:hypothetical protein